MAPSARGVPIKETIPLGLVRKAMARGMKAAVDSAALSQISREVDVHDVQAVRKRWATEGRRVSLNTCLLYAVTCTLPRHPLLNAELHEDEIFVYEPVNLGVAVAVPEGLMVVVVPGAHALSLDEMEQAVRQRVDRARAGRLKLPDIEGGTFTVSNLGMYGVDTGFPIPRPPESAILLVGAAYPRPVVRDDQLMIRETAWFSLGYDHRFIDGATAAAFLQDLQATLGNAEAVLGVRSQEDAEC